MAVRWVGRGTRLGDLRGVSVSAAARIETSANSASTCAALTLVALGTKLSRTDSSLAFICVSRWPPLRLGGERSVRFAAE